MFGLFGDDELRARPERQGRPVCTLANGYKVWSIEEAARLDGVVLDAATPGDAELWSRALALRNQPESDSEGASTSATAPAFSGVEFCVPVYEDGQATGEYQWYRQVKDVPGFEVEDGGHFVSWVDELYPGEFVKLRHPVGYALYKGIIARIDGPTPTDPDPTGTDPDTSHAVGSSDTAILTSTKENPMPTIRLSRTTRKALTEAAIQPELMAEELYDVLSAEAEAYQAEHPYLTASDEERAEGRRLQLRARHARSVLASFSEVRERNRMNFFWKYHQEDGMKVMSRLASMRQVMARRLSERAIEARQAGDVQGEHRLTVLALRARG